LYAMCEELNLLARVDIVLDMRITV
jgi:hypothetical protein